MRPLVALLLILSAALAAVGDAARPSVTGRILFASERGSTLENRELYSVRIDGSARRALSRNPLGADGGARWSPDGKWIAFVSERIERGRRIRGLYLMRSGGGSLRRLTPLDLAVSPEFEEPPSWSPDGRRLAFSGERRARQSLWTVRRDGTGLRRLASGAAPAWSPRGGRIAFADRGRIYAVPARGGRRRLLARGPFDGDPAWSPDGRRIAFVRSNENGDRQALHVVSSRGGALRRILGGVEDIGAPQWSPDGRKILVAAAPGLYLVRVRERAAARLRRGAWPAWSPDGRRIAFTLGSGLFVMNADGRGARRVRNERGFDLWGAPAWSPDGKTLAYATIRAESDLEVFAVDAAGSRLRQLTHNSVHDLAPAWSPTRRRIAFVRAGAVWLMAADGSGQRRLLTATQPSWSPDGSRLAVTRAGAVHVVSMRNGAVTRVAPGTSPAWSPVGDEIAFVRGLRLVVVYLSTGTERTIVDAASACPAPMFESWLVKPDWSPDGRQLVYAVVCDDGRFAATSAEVVRADGTARRALRLDELAPTGLAWSPDAARVAFASEEPARRIGTAKLDGTARTTVIRDESGAAYVDLDW